MSMDSSTVKRLFHLARLEAKEQDLPAYQKDLEAMLDKAVSLESIDTSQVEPTFFVTPQQNVFRADEVTPSLSPDEVLQEAPTRIHRYFRLPKVIENI